MEPGDNRERICYKQNYLTQVVARIDLASPFEDISKKLPASLSKVARRSFPVQQTATKTETQLQVQMQPEGGAQEVQRVDRTFTEWRFTDLAGSKTLLIAPSVLLIAYSRYSSYDDLKADLDGIVSEFWKGYPDAQVARLGLRYINEIDAGSGDPLRWGRYINSELLGLLKFGVGCGQFIRVFHNMEVTYDEFLVRFQFGLHNPDYPAPIVRRSFVLDYDAYSVEALEVGEIGPKLDACHSAIQKLFESSISKQLKKEMGAQDA